MLSLYTCELQEEESAGRFHARIAFRREVFDSAGGWPLTKRGDFDQTFLRRLADAGTTVDPCRDHPLSYVFRWGSTNSYHGQGLMYGPSDVEWYVRVSGEGLSNAKGMLVPAFDKETVRLFHMVPRIGFATND